MYNTNEAFNARISGRNIYTNKNAEGIDLEGSGRTVFWKNGVDIWWQGSVYEFFFGVGLDKVIENNYLHTNTFVKYPNLRQIWHAR